jgi:hypothetical protein
VKKLNVLAVTIAMLFVPVAFADEASNGALNPNHVQGEKLDSGLGEIAAHYCDPEFIGNSVLGEKLDSGLGELTQEEIDRVVEASRQTITASNGH